mgnify:CR=1 FL=1
MAQLDFESMSLRDLLKETGITQKSIAKKAKVSPAAVSLVVAGKSKSRRIEELIRKETAKSLKDEQVA